MAVPLADIGPRRQHLYLRELRLRQHICAPHPHLAEQDQVELRLLRLRLRRRLFGALALALSTEGAHLGGFKETTRRRERRRHRIDLKERDETKPTFSRSSLLTSHADENGRELWPTCQPRDPVSEPSLFFSRPSLRRPSDPIKSRTSSEN